MRYLLLGFLALLPAVLATALTAGCQHGSAHDRTRAPAGRGGAQRRATEEKRHARRPRIPLSPLPLSPTPGAWTTIDVTRFASVAWGYEVNSPLWSDQADKERAFVLPLGGKIQVLTCSDQPSGCLDAADDGKWVLPAGTTLLKNFGFDGKVVETRLLVALPDATWVGYSYQWNEAQTAATLVPSAGASVTFNTGARVGGLDLPEPARLQRMPHAQRGLVAGARDRADEPGARFGGARNAKPDRPVRRRRTVRQRLRPSPTRRRW